MKKKIYFIVTFCLLACKKVPLEGDAAILEGKWKWIKTIKYDDGTPYTFIIDPSNRSDYNSIEFHQKGKLSYFTNGEKSKCKKIEAIENDGATSPGNYLIFVRPKDEPFFKLYVKNSSTDTLVIYSHFPFADEVIYHYVNYFVREN